MQLYPVHRSVINMGLFPLNHDTICKVTYRCNGLLRFEYFSCRSVDSGEIALIISSLSMVKNVVFVLVDDLTDDF